MGFGSDGIILQPVRAHVFWPKSFDSCAAQYLHFRLGCKGNFIRVHEQRCCQ